MQATDSVNLFGVRILNERLLECSLVWLPFPRVLAYLLDLSIPLRQNLVSWDDVPPHRTSLFLCPLHDFIPRVHQTRRRLPWRAVALGINQAQYSRTLAAASEKYTRK